MKEKGFTALEITLMVAILAVAGFAGWSWWSTQQTDQAENTEQATNIDAETEKSNQEIPEGWVQHEHKKLGYTFWHPAEWTIEDSANVNDGTYYGVILKSKPYKSEDDLMYGAYVTQGSKITLYTPSSFSGDNLTETFQGLQKQLYENGTIDPEPVEINGRRGIEYAYQYEGPRILYTKFFISDDKIVLASFEANGKESNHPNYQTFKQILETFKLK